MRNGIEYYARMIFTVLWQTILLIGVLSFVVWHLSKPIPKEISEYEGLANANVVTTEPVDTSGIEAEFGLLEERISTLEQDMEGLLAEFEKLSEDTKYRISFTDGEFNEFATLVQHEAGGESYDCRVWVASAIVNRVLDNRYPDNLYDVIYDTKYAVQFSPIINGLYKIPSEKTIKACKDALIKDYAQGSWIFNNKSLTSSDKQQWFEKFEIVAEIDGVQFRR